MAEEFFGDEIFTLTDDEGNENQFELIGSHELDGVTYLALVPLDEKGEDHEEGEYVILKLDIDDNGEEVLVTIDDDDEFDRIADIFDEELFGEIDYDETDGDDIDEE
jgi:uncharacterized protein YrzB (UPF0473 family)